MWGSNVPLNPKHAKDDIDHTTASSDAVSVLSHGCFYQRTSDHYYSGAFCCMAKCLVATTHESLCSTGGSCTIINFMVAALTLGSVARELSSGTTRRSQLSWWRYIPAYNSLRKVICSKSPSSLLDPFLRDSGCH